MRLVYNAIILTGVIGNICVMVHGSSSSTDDMKSTTSNKDRVESLGPSATNNPNMEVNWGEVVGVLEKLVNELSDQRTIINNNNNNSDVNPVDVQVEALLAQVHLLENEMTDNAFRIKNLKTNYESLNKSIMKLYPEEKMKEGCFEPFVKTKLGCFWFHKMPTKSWSDARKRCQMLGADLAVIHDMKNITEVLNNYGRDWVTVFVGATRDHTGVWKWLDGTRVNLPGADWRLYKGDCLAFSGGRSWARRPTEEKCGSTNYYICEMKLT